MARHGPGPQPSRGRGRAGDAVSYADAAMADAGVRCPAEPWRAVREGEFYDVTFGALVCVGIAGEWGGCRSLTDAERDRVVGRFGGAESIASGQAEARRLAYGTPFDDVA